MTSSGYYEPLPKIDWSQTPREIVTKNINNLILTLFSCSFINDLLFCAWILSVAIEILPAFQLACYSCSFLRFLFSDNLRSNKRRDNRPRNGEPAVPSTSSLLQEFGDDVSPWNTRESMRTSEDVAQLLVSYGIVVVSMNLMKNVTYLPLRLVVHKASKELRHGLCIICNPC